LKKETQTKLIDKFGKVLTVRLRKAEENLAKNHLFIKDNRTTDWTPLRKKDIFYIAEGNSTLQNIDKIKEVISKNTFIIMCSANILPFLLENDIKLHFCVLEQPYAPRLKFSQTKGITLCAKTNGCHDWVRKWKGGINFFPPVEGFIGESDIGYTCVLADYYQVRSITVIGGEFFWYEVDPNPYFYRPQAIVEGKKITMEMEINKGCLTYTYLYNAATFLNKEFGEGLDNPRRLIYTDVSECYMDNIKKIPIEDFVYMLKDIREVVKEK